MSGWNSVCLENANHAVEVGRPRYCRCRSTAIVTTYAGVIARVPLILLKKSTRRRIFSMRFLLLSQNHQQLLTSFLSHRINSSCHAGTITSTWKIVPAALCCYPHLPIAENERAGKSALSVERWASCAEWCSYRWSFPIPPLTVRQHLLLSTFGIPEILDTTTRTVVS